MCITVNAINEVIKVKPLTWQKVYHQTTSHTTNQQQQSHNEAPNTEVAPPTNTTANNNPISLARSRQNEFTKSQKPIRDPIPAKKSASTISELSIFIATGVETNSRIKTSKRSNTSKTVTETRTNALRYSFSAMAASATHQLLLFFDFSGKTVLARHLVEKTN